MKIVYSAINRTHFLEPAWKYISNTAGMKPLTPQRLKNIMFDKKIVIEHPWGHTDLWGCFVRQMTMIRTNHFPVPEDHHMTSSETVLNALVSAKIKREHLTFNAIFLINGGFPQLYRITQNGLHKSLTVYAVQTI
jgi:hypothetical protein